MKLNDRFHQYKSAVPKCIINTFSADGVERRTPLLWWLYLNNQYDQSRMYFYDYRLRIIAYLLPEKQGANPAVSALTRTLFGKKILKQKESEKMPIETTLRKRYAEKKFPILSWKGPVFRALFRRIL